MFHNLDARRLATVLAALRCFQHTVQEESPEGSHANMLQFTDPGLDPLKPDEIEKLIHDFQFTTTPEFILWGPDNFPTNREPIKGLGELAREAASFPLRFIRQGYYRDASMRQIPLEDIPGLLRVTIDEPDEDDDDDN